MSQPADTFIHCACVYSDDGQFLDAAVPFLAEGIALGQPVLAVTTPAHLDLLSAALGSRRGDVDHANSETFGRRPPRRLAACYRYWRASRDGATWTGATWAGEGGAGTGATGVRILAEPLWGGGSAREITAWVRMEAALNVALAPTSISMLCPYDARVVDQPVIANVLQTHPTQATGPRRSPSPGYTDPAEFARGCDTAPLAGPSGGAEAFGFDGDLRGLRRFIAASAAAYGMAGDRAEMLMLAVSEVGAYLKSQWPASATVRTWQRPGAVVCDLRQPGCRITDPFLGLRPAELVPGDGDGLWLANQICDWLDIRSGDEGCAIQMQLSRRADHDTAARRGIS